MSTARTGSRGPVIGWWVPAVTLHVMFFGVACVLSLLVLAPPLWLAGGLLLAAGAVLVPRVVPAWWLLLVLGVSQFWREPSAANGVYYFLLAGMHLLHVLGALVRVVKWDGRIQVVALVRPLQRFVLIQAVMQPLALGSLLAFSERGTVRGLSIIAAAALAALALVLARTLHQARSWGQR